jgi:hypothetical protein
MATTLLKALDEMIAAHPGCVISDGGLNWNPVRLIDAIKEEIEDYEWPGTNPATEERYVYCDGPFGGRPGVYRLTPGDYLRSVPEYEPRLPG